MDNMRIKIYRLRAFKNGILAFEYDYEFKDDKYQEMKSRLRSWGYRVEERFAWS